MINLQLWIWASCLSTEHNTLYLDVVVFGTRKICDNTLWTPICLVSWWEWLRHPLWILYTWWFCIVWLSGDFIEIFCTGFTRDYVMSNRAFCSPSCFEIRPRGAVGIAALLCRWQIAGGPRVRLKTIDPPKGNGLGQKKCSPSCFEMLELCFSWTRCYWRTNMRFEEVL